MGIVGDLHNLRRKVVNFKWKIKDFLQFPVEANKRYESPKFSFCGTSWEIWIYPNGHTLHTAVGFIAVYVAAKSLAEPISVDCSFHLETVDGKADTVAKWSYTSIFEKTNPAWGRTKLISRSKLMERKSELLPSEVLTVICTLKKIGPSDAVGSSTVKKFTQTEKETGSSTVKKFTQTEKETGSVSIDEFTQTEEEETGVYKLQQHFKEILEKGNVTDVLLKVDGQEFKSHRCVLAARSPVFLAMMTHDTKEKNTGIVDIEDTDANTFSEFIEYLYTGSEKIVTQGNVVKLYIAADKYQVDELKNSCLGYMLKNITVDNFCDVLSLSLEHVDKDLTNACVQFFIENSLAIILTPKWLTFLGKNLVAGNELLVKHLKNK